MKVIVGLGNPGVQYSATRHNAGFRVVDKLATEAGASFAGKRGLMSEVARTALGGQDALLVKPMTYMNLSGQAVLAVLQWYKIDLDELLVVHDDVALPLGRIRFQRHGGAGGQHGVESVIECLGGARQFDRLKIGVGPDPGGSERADYVLSPVLPAERELFERCLCLAAEAVAFWCLRGSAEAMNKYNGIDLRDEEPAEKASD
ncbi:MAG TPA: aminoacyl-tRNA hydrolase [Candidatus Obscuribacterales bacterium]